MRFCVLFIGTWTAVIALELSVGLIEADPIFTDVDKKISSPASDVTSPSNEFSLQNEANIFNDGTNPSLPPAVDSLISYSAIPGDSAIDENGDDLNMELPALALDSSSDDDSLEENCTPDKSATPEKLWKRESACKVRINDFENNHREEDPTNGVDPATIEKLNNLLTKEDQTWRQQNGRTSYKERSNPCSSNKDRPIPVCCSGPRVPNRELIDTGLRAVLSLQHCLEFYLNRPRCTDPDKRFCCLFLIKNIAIDRWGYWGADCVQMAA